MAFYQAPTIKVLVVDDSAFMRKVLSDILNSDPEIEVVDTARHGLDAIEKVQRCRPDVVTLDIEMPVMDGLTCLRELLAREYIPVIMLSSLTRKGAEETLQALEDGAVDFITKPENIFDVKNNHKVEELIDKVKMARKAVKPRKLTINCNKVKAPEDNRSSGVLRNIIAIGTSTGGPKALQHVVPLFPGDLPAALLIVQHMPPGFTRSLAERLNNLSNLTVKEAEDEETVRAGYAYIAPGDYHMEVVRQGEFLKIKLNHEPPAGGHRPSVNVMMEALSKTGFKNIIGVIMTGMGSDGSKGISRLKQDNKACIIAQDEKSCVVYGMPKAAVQTGMVDKIVPLTEITQEVMKIVEVHK